MKPSFSALWLVNVTLATLATLLSACGETTPPVKTGGTVISAGGGASEAHRKTAPLVFEAKTAGKKPFPFALVAGKVGDQPTHFIVDTGASAHAIDASIAAAADVASPAKTSSITLDEWGPLGDRPLAIIELPARLKEHGIGGVIAPQQLADAGDAVVVDLLNRQMRLRPKSTAWTELNDFGVVLTPPEQRKFCAVDAGGMQGLVLAVDGTIEGEPARLAIDTGAGRTRVIEGSKAGAKAATHPVLGRSMAVGAATDVAASIHGGVPIAVGAWATTADVGVAPGERHPQCGYEGRIGMDVLSQCAVGMATDEFLLACRAPSK